MIVADDKQSLQITGNGDVLEPHDGIIGERVLLPISQCCIVVSSAQCDRLITVIVTCSYWIWRSVCIGSSSRSD